MGDCSDILYEDLFSEKIGGTSDQPIYRVSFKDKTSWDYVLEDIAKRERMGYNKYGKYLTEDTDEDMLNHAYNEALDLVVYLRTLILQRGGRYDPSL